MKTYADDPVNPVSSLSYKHEDGACLTKREYFASQALVTTWFKTPQEAATHALAAADALIAKLNEGVKS